MTMARVLILFAHPALHRSRVNRALARAVQELDGVTFRDLYEVYPDLHIIASSEQRLLEAHDIIVFQFPFYWYSTPAILKEWQDVVLEHGWAYGRSGVALRGKRLLCAVTTGGREAAYQPDGYNRFTMRQLLAPLEQTAFLCGMDFAPPFVVHGTHALTDRQIGEHARDWARVVSAIRDDEIDWEAWRSLTRINATPGGATAGAEDSHAR